MTAQVPPDLATLGITVPVNSTPYTFSHFPYYFKIINTAT